ncbi:hypothetical protein PARMER_01096 [Parabacteroides merdae ATCC 43184]|nr:hypothetical protein PARMER_01096 [Parabacteroides merdae ATCC 43184]
MASTCEVIVCGSLTMCSSACAVETWCIGANNRCNSLVYKGKNSSGFCLDESGADTDRISLSMRRHIW